jgi:hypothetical protein
MGCHNWLIPFDSSATRGGGTANVWKFKAVVCVVSSHYIYIVGRIQLYDHVARASGNVSRKPKACIKVRAGCAVFAIKDL